MGRVFSAGLEGAEYSGALHRATTDHAPLALKNWKRSGVSGKIRERRKGSVCKKSSNDSGKEKGVSVIENQLQRTS
jgi:hypothetical protein